MDMMESHSVMKITDFFRIQERGVKRALEQDPEPIQEGPAELEEEAKDSEGSGELEAKEEQVPSTSALPRSRNVLDIINYIDKAGCTDDATKYGLIQQRQPEPAFVFPSKQYKDPRRKSGFMQRQCRPDWLKKYPTMAYSAESDGLFCLACILFPTPSQSSRSHLLIDKPYTNWKDAQVDLKHHCQLCYHLKSEAKIDAFMHTYNNPTSRIDQQLSSKTTEQVQRNRRLLTSILRCIEYCARQGISLRGHRDDSTSDNINRGNLRALLSLCIESGDKELSAHLETGAKNAQYISKTAQNELVVCIKEYVQEQIVKDIQMQSDENGVAFYGIQADEVRDTSNVEQLGVVIRYIQKNTPVEKLVEFVDCQDIKGASLCQKLLACLEGLKLNPNMCRAQTYDGAGNMAGVTNGCAAHFKRVVPQAHYYHCASHSLNLALCKASKIPEVQTMMGNLQAVGIFFKYSPKRHQRLSKALGTVNTDRKSKGKPTIASEKVKLLCETRWVERHTALEDFNSMYEATLDCLEAIARNEDNGWDAKAITEGNGLLTAITSPQFLAAFQVNLSLFAYTKGLSIMLQGSTQDVVNAYEEVSVVRDTLSDIRKEAHREYSNIFKKSEKMAEVAGTNMMIPRRCSRQNRRNNVPADSPEAYWRRAVFVPFLDELLGQLTSRFPALTAQALIGLKLLPKSLQNITEEDAAKLEESYGEDLPSPSSLSAEIRLWRRKWEASESKPQSLQATLAMTSRLMFPNIHRILYLLLIIPVTSAGVERANSAMKLVKTVLRSTMQQDRLNGLLLVFVHKDIELDYSAIIDTYSRKHPRRMRFLNPLSMH